MNAVNPPKNESGIRPVGHQVLVRPDPWINTTESGILLATPATASRDAMRQTEGVVIALGNDAYCDKSSPWCQPGDRVVFPLYVGTVHRVGSDEDPTDYRLMADTDIKAVFLSKE